MGDGVSHKGDRITRRRVEVVSHMGVWSGERGVVTGGCVSHEERSESHSGGWECFQMVGKLGGGHQDHMKGTPQYILNSVGTLL